MIVYVASAIDDDSGSGDIRSRIISAVIKSDKSIVVFAPHDAWKCPPPIDMHYDDASRICCLDASILDMCDAILVYWKRGIVSVGVPMEISEVVGLRDICSTKPVVIIKEDYQRSVMLKALSKKPGVLVLDSVDGFVDDMRNPESPNFERLVEFLNNDINANIP